MWCEIGVDHHFFLDMYLVVITALVKKTSLVLLNHVDAFLENYLSMCGPPCGVSVLFHRSVCLS